MTIHNTVILAISTNLTKIPRKKDKNIFGEFHCQPYVQIFAKYKRVNTILMYFLHNPLPALLAFDVVL